MCGISRKQSSTEVQIAPSACNEFLLNLPFSGYNLNRDCIDPITSAVTFLVRANTGTCIFYNIV